MEGWQEKGDADLITNRDLAPAIPLLMGRLDGLVLDSYIGALVWLAG